MSVDKYLDFLQQAFAFMRYSRHHICNHLTSVDGDEGEGEVYTLAYLAIPDGKGAWMEDFMAVHYIDRDRREQDGRWRFAKRVVTYDLKARRPLDLSPAEVDVTADASYAELSARLFVRGERA